MMNKEIEEKIKKSMPALAELFMGIALGDKVFTGGKSQETAANKVWDSISPMIKRMGEVQVLEAQSTADVIELLGKGKVTITDAKDLMQMLSTKSDIEDVKILLEKVNALTGSDISS